MAFAMECYERCCIPEDILEGQKVLSGDKEIILKLIEDIAFKRTKLGELLSSGVKHAAEVLDKNTAEKINVKCTQGWDKEGGLPTRQKLEQRELTMIADKLDSLKV